MTELETLKFIEFGVLIRAQEVDTKLVNETLLRRSKIIQESDVAKLSSTIVTPIHSSIEFENGLEIAADKGRMRFTQYGEFTAGHENRCPQLAMDFVENLSLRIPIVSLSTIFKAVIPSTVGDLKSTTTTRFFKDDATWSIWKETLPQLGFKAIYERKNLTTTLEVGTATKSDDEATTGEIYEVNFHRDLPMSSLELKYSSMMDILIAWEADLVEFISFISNFRLV